MSVDNDRDCPACGETISASWDEIFSPDVFLCPHCGAALSWDWDDMGEAEGLVIWLRRSSVDEEGKPA